MRRNLRLEALEKTSLQRSLGGEKSSNACSPTGFFFWGGGGGTRGEKNPRSSGLDGHDVFKDDSFMAMKLSHKHSVVASAENSGLEGSKEENASLSSSV